MKKILFFFAAALVIAGCESQEAIKYGTAQPEISFEYREVGDRKVEFRNTSTPEFTREYFWWYFHNGKDNIAPYIGAEGWRFLPTATYTVTMQYKPGKIAGTYDKVLKTCTFTMTITGVADSVWHVATPKE